MSTAVFPQLLGQGFEFTRTAMWPESNIITAVSGKETSIAYQATPRWQWEISFEFIRQGERNAVTYTEMEQIAGFFNQRQGPFDSFQYLDNDDNAVAGAHLGIGNGVNVAFPLIRVFGGFAEPILAPNAVNAVYVDGTLVDPAHYSVSAWGTPVPGVITFQSGSIPGNGLIVTADFTYYWPVRFLEQQMDFVKFMKALYSVKSIKMISKK